MSSLVIKNRQGSFCTALPVFEISCISVFFSTNTANGGFPVLPVFRSAERELCGAALMLWLYKLSPVSDMLRNSFLCFLLVTGLHGPNDLKMLCRDRGPALGAGSREFFISADDALDHIQQIVQCLIMAQRVDILIKSLAFLIKHLCILGLLIMLYQLIQRLNIGILQMLDRLGHSQALQSLTAGVCFGDFLLVQRSHNRSVIWNIFHEAIAGQPPDRFSYRCSAHIHLFGQMLLFQLSSRRQGSVGDQLYQISVNLFI